MTELPDYEKCLNKTYKHSYQGYAMSIKGAVSNALMLHLRRLF